MLIVIEIDSDSKDIYNLDGSVKYKMRLNLKGKMVNFD